MKSYWKVERGGSGFVVNDKLVGTAAHVVDLSPSSLCPPTTWPEPCILRLVVKTFLGDKLTGMHPATVMGTDYVNDTAVLHVPTLVGVGPAHFAKVVYVDSEVIQTGNPRGIPNVSTRGRITSVEQQRYVKGDPRPYMLVKFSAETHNGNSGGAVRDDLAQVVGVTIAKSLLDDTGYMVGVYRFEKLLERLRTDKALARKNKNGQKVWRVKSS